MELYDLTLKKEVARECAWGIMGTISRIKDKIGETEFLKIVQKKIGLEMQIFNGDIFRNGGNIKIWRKTIQMMS